jgi:hypothetical protein
MNWRWPRLTGLAPRLGRDRGTAGIGTFERRMSGPNVTHLRALQALDQEQAAFEQRRAQRAAEFRLQQTMGWATLVLLAVSVAMAMIQPWILVGLGPGTGFAFWYWRRLIGRGLVEVSPMTTPPLDDKRRFPRGE